MFHYFEKHLNGGKKVNTKESFYVGDAAGRPPSGSRKKDFSDSDHKYAVNVGLQFRTPEMFYLGAKETLPAFPFDPRAAFKKDGSIFKGKTTKSADIPSKSKEMVIFVGPPGAGKSTFWQNHLKDYVRVNNDTLKTKQKCQKVAEEACSSGKSVVIDNTNPGKQIRSEYLKIAKQHGYTVRCFFFNMTKDAAFHLNELRNVNKHRKHLSGVVPDMPIHKWFKDLEVPSKGEGFEAVEEVESVVGPFLSKEEEELFFMHAI
jgi:bifunctional polynucleotide phosphatase/kinase